MSPQTAVSITGSQGRQLKRTSSRAKGFALVSVIGMGAFALAIMFGLFPFVLNAIQYESGSRYISELRIAAESGVDYAVSQLNEAAASQLPCPIDPGAGLSKISLLPAMYQANPNIQVQIQVRRLAASDWTAVKSYSSLYSAQLDPLNLAPTTAATAFSSPTRTTVDLDYWRIVEVTARRGSFSRSVRVILEPRFDPPPNGGGPTANSYKPYFSNSFFANSLIQTNPGAGKTLTITGGGAYDTGAGWAYPLTMQTNQMANIGTGTQLMGNLKVSNGTMGAPAAVAIGPALDGGASEIHGLLNTNSSVTNFSNVTPAPSASNPLTDNVLADADMANSPSAPRASPNDVPIDTSNGGSPLGVTPTQVNTSSVPLPDLGSLASSNSSLPAGNYVTGSLSTQGFSQGVTLGSGATNIYIADGASQSAAVDISSAMFNNAGSALNLQIWYSGTRPVNLDLSAGMNFNGVIYAPNAPITVTGTGGFQGALNGDKVLLNNSTANSGLQMQILTSINSGSSVQPPPGAAPGYAVNSQGNPEVQGYKPVTWQESNVPFVGP